MIACVPQWPCERSMRHVVKFDAKLSLLFHPLDSVRFTGLARIPPDPDNRFF